MEYQVGDKLDNQYVIVEKHHGGMSTVYVVRDEFSNKRFAVKTVREALLADAQAVYRFAEEGRTWMKLGRHEHIVEAIIYREIEGQPFLFLEYVDGGDLQNLLNRERTLFLPQLLDFSLQVCSGMQYVHTVEISPAQRGVIHRDLKPGNMMLTRRAQVKITDFGLAKVYGARHEATTTGRGLGTYFFMPPEQFLDAASADERSDIYAFGVFLYVATTGEVPVPGRTVAELAHNLLNRDPVPPAQLRAGVPAALDAEIMRCLSRRRTDRPDSFAELGTALGGLLAELERDPRWRVPVQTCTTCHYTTQNRYSPCPICASTFAPAQWGAPGEPETRPAGPAASATMDTARVAEQLRQQARQDEKAGRLEQALNSLRRAAALDRDNAELVGELDRVAALYSQQRSRERSRIYNWPTLNGNATRNGFSPESVAPPFTLRWKVAAGEWALASPVVANGVVYVAAAGAAEGPATGTGGGDRGHLVAYDASHGQERWRRRFPRELTLTPVVVGGERLLVPVDRELVCLAVEDGAPCWSYPGRARLTASPAVWEHNVYFGDEAGAVCALHWASGNLVWSTEVEGGVYTAPAVWKDRLFVGTVRNRLVCLSARDGTEYWQYVAGAEVTSGPSLHGNLVLFGAADHRVYCLLQSSGRLLWEFETQGEVHSTPALVGEAAIFGSRDGSLYCVELRTGSLRWEYRTSDWVETSPAISENFIYCAGHDGWLRVLEAASGLSLWEYEVGEEIRCSPALSGGSVFLVTSGARVHAFRAH
jgi:outer membrane protein assembly factor BamB/tRNA A-37 threonylcarbamoyl transferase component Bud32